MTRPLLAAAAADPDTAALLAGADVLVAYHSSVLRRMGLPSVAGLLPWASANELTLGIVAGVVAGAEQRPVLATVCANDLLRPPERVLPELARLGASGILNAPTVALLTGPVRAAIEEAGLGFQREVELMTLAGEHGLRAWGYACTPDQAAALARHGAEAVVVHLGITRPGLPTAAHAATLARAAAAARAVSPHVRVLAHGGPLTHPAAFAALCGEDGVHFGFFGASVFEHAADPVREVRCWREVLDR